MSKRVFIKTYGCQMNVYDSSRMAELLSPLGYRAAAKPEGADLVILNTCHIREKAAEKVFAELGQIRLLKGAKARGGGQMLIAVGGCLAQAEGAELLRRAPFVDIVFGPQTYHRLPEMVARATRVAARRRANQDGGAQARRPGVIDTDFPPEPKFDFLPEPGGAGPAAFLSVQEGCDKFCTFCVVPYTRGPELSRPVDDVLAECAGLLAAGSVELTLLGQNVNGYRGAGPDGEEWDFTMLLYAVARLPGLKRLRFTTSHPIEMNAGLAEAFAVIPALMPYLHLPVQSGADPVLAAMNRGYTREQYLDKVRRLRELCPDLRLTTDLIVGFPGEPEADFAATLALVEELRYADAFTFLFSPRPGTAAAFGGGVEPIGGDVVAHIGREQRVGVAILIPRGD